MMLVTASVAMGCVVKSAAVKNAAQASASTASARQSPVAAAPDACAAAGTARRALRRPCLLIEVSPPERLPSASRAGKPRLALDYLSPLDYERILVHAREPPHARTSSRMPA